MVDYKFVRLHTTMPPIEIKQVADDPREVFTGLEK
jgi:hypothetical protein